MKNNKLTAVKKKTYSLIESHHADVDIEEGDFILVNFVVKVNTIHYIGLVLDAHKYNVKYLKRGTATNNFQFPVIDNIALCSGNEIVAKLKKLIKYRLNATLRFYNDIDGI